MTNSEILSIIGKQHKVEKIVRKITKNGNTVYDGSTIDDLIQDIYVCLMGDEKLSGLYERNQLDYYITRMVMNNIVSTSSPYYRTYIRPQQLSNEITDTIIDKLSGSDKDNA